MDMFADAEGGTILGNSAERANLRSQEEPAQAPARNEFPVWLFKQELTSNHSSTPGRTGITTGDASGAGIGNKPGHIGEEQEQATQQGNIGVHDDEPDTTVIIRAGHGS